jgi:UDP-glucose 4-epimerase
MNILITGGNGFLAKNIHNKLVENHINVTSITRQDNFDLRDTKSTSVFLKDKYFDAVLHCAILGGKRLVQDPVDIVNDNIRMATNILINKDCIKVSTLDTSKVSLTYIKLDAKKFESYYCEKPVVLGIDTSTFFKAIKSANRRETITFYIS